MTSFIPEMVYNAGTGEPQELFKPPVTRQGMISCENRLRDLCDLRRLPSLDGVFIFSLTEGADGVKMYYIH